MLLMIKYLGSKKKLIDLIYRVIQQNHTSGAILDAFSGTARVGYALKDLGCPIISNDHNAYAYTSAVCYVKANAEHARLAQMILDELRTVKGQPGWFTQNFCEDARYIQPFNGERIDAMRERIEELDIEPVVREVVLNALVEAADRVDSTVGLQMAYLKGWSKRSYNDLELRLPLVKEGHSDCDATQLEADEFIHQYEADIVYLDPPYNQHSYLGNYHLWESLVLWDKPELYGVARKRIDCRTRKSPFNSKKKCFDALRKVVRKSKCNTLVLSYSNEGYIKIEDLIAWLRQVHNEVEVLSVDYTRHICHQIGVYNTQGVRVGEIGKLSNKEYIIVCKGYER